MNDPRSWPTTLRVIAADTTVSTPTIAAADRPGRPPAPPAAAGQQRQHGDGEPRRGAVAAPPHRIGRHGDTDRVRRRRRARPRAAGAGVPAAPGRRRPASSTGALASEAELLIAQQADDARRDEPEAALAAGAIRRGGIRRAVDPPERRQPAGRRHHAAPRQRRERTPRVAPDARRERRSPRRSHRPAAQSRVCSHGSVARTAPTPAHAVGTSGRRSVRSSATRARMPAMAAAAPTGSG